MNQTRIITGLIIAFSLLLAILYLPSNIIIFFASCIVGISLWEHLRLRFHILISSCISLFFVLFLLLSPQNFLPLQTLIFIGLIYWMIMGIMVLIFPHNKGFIQQRMFWAPASLIMHLSFWAALVLVLSSTNSYPFTNLGIDTYPSFSLVILITIGALMDSIAYFSGKKFGRRKFLPNISPNKTLEGAFISILLTPIIVLSFLGLFFSPNWFPLIVIIFIACFFSIIGDATASLYKRIAGVKDSSNLIPGHGGILDRIDSHLATFPVFLTSLYLYEFF